MVYVESNVYVSFGSRACSEHWVDNILQVPLNFHSSHIGINVSSEEIVGFFKTVRTSVHILQNKKVSFISMDSKLLYFETGLNHYEFKNILSFFPQDSHKKNEAALGVYLSRVKHGYTFEELAAHWSITRQTASKYYSLCINILKTEFLNTYLSLNTSRQ